MFYFKDVRVLAIFCLLSFLVLWGHQGAEAVTYADPAKTFPNYPLSFTAGKTVTAPAIPLSGAINEDFLLLFTLNNADISKLTVTITRPNAAYMTPRVFQLRPAPVNLDDVFLVDGMAPLGRPDLNLPGNPLYLAIGLKINKVHPPGTYKYLLTMTSGANVVKQPLTVTVWPFALPDDLPITLYANFCYKPDWFAQYGVSPDTLDKTILPAYLAAMRAYKINAVGLGYYPFPTDMVAAGTAAVSSAPDFTKALDTIVRYGFRGFRIPDLLSKEYTPTQLGQPGNQFAFKGPVYYQAWYKYLKEKGWVDKALVKLWDEPTPEQIPMVQESYNIMKSAVPEFATLCAGGPPDPRLTHAIDKWTMYSRTYNPQADAAARSLGQESWLYANRLHGAKRWATNQRIIGWHLFRYNFSGYLIWSINYFDPDPWTAQPDLNTGNRAGTWFYPDPATGKPLPTLRLEALRRGFEDYQYLVLLKQAYQNGKVSDADYNSVMQAVTYATIGLKKDSVPYSWNDFEAVRLQIGNLLKSVK